MNRLFHIRVLLCFFAFVCIGLVDSARAQVTPGSIMFVGFNADGNDGFALVALAAIPAGTILYFTDNNWNGTVLTATEGTITWTVTTAIPAGNVIVFSNTGTGPVAVNYGTASLVGSLNLSASGESIYCFLGTSGTTPTTFITAYSSDSYGGGNTLAGTGLTAGTNAVSNSGANDVCVYVSPGACTGTMVACSTQIALSTNWTCEDGAGDQSNNGGIDFPTSLPTAPNVSVLPIELIYFTAERDESNEVQLNWATASEINNDFFTVDWSLDGEVWYELKRIFGVGNSSTLQLYSTIDDRFFVENTYYRLSQTDFNGVSERFKVISLSGAQLLESELSIFPNPSLGKVNIIGDKIGKETINLFDGIGRECSNSVEIRVISENHILLDFQNSKPAIYLVRIGEQTKMIETH